MLKVSESLCLCLWWQVSVCVCVCVCVCKDLDWEESRQTNTYHVQDWHKTAKGLATVPRDTHTHTLRERQNVSNALGKMWHETVCHSIYTCRHTISGFVTVNVCVSDFCICRCAFCVNICVFLHLNVCMSDLCIYHVSRWAVCGIVHVNVQVLFFFIGVCADVQVWFIRLVQQLKRWHQVSSCSLRDVRRSRAREGLNIDVRWERERKRWPKEQFTISSFFLSS